MATNNGCDYSPTQYAVQVGGASGTLSSISPSSTSGVPVISQGASSNPTFGTAVVAGGGTGAVTLTGVLTGNGTSAVTANTVTQHGVLLGGATNAVSSLGVAATGTVLAGVTSSDPAFTATPSVTSITLNGGSALSTFTDWTSFTPTLVGTTVAGTTTYTTQFGTYMRIGNQVTVNITLSWSAATGTGNMTIQGLPFTINNTTNYFAIGSVLTTATTWPAGATMIVAQGFTGTTSIYLLATGTTGAGFGFVQMANSVSGLYCQLTYRV